MARNCGDLRHLTKVNELRRDALKDEHNQKSTRWCASKKNPHNIVLFFHEEKEDHKEEKLKAKQFGTIINRTTPGRVVQVVLTSGPQIGDVPFRSVFGATPKSDCHQNQV